MSSQDGSKSDLLVSNKPLTNRFDTTERNAMSRSPVCISRPGSPAGATSATEWQVEVGCERPLNLKCTGSPGSSGSGFSSAGVDGNSNTLVKNISDDSNAHTSQGMADLSTNATFSVNTTQLMDIGDSILHEISGVSGLHDTLASQSDPGCPAHKCSGHHARSGALESSTLSLSLDRLPRVLSSSRNSQVTLLEDIGDSILNYSNGTDAEEDVERLNSRQAQDQEEVEANVCANNVIQDKSLDPRGQDIPEVESGQTDIEIIINKWDEEVELISERDEHAPKCEETTTDIDQQSLNGDCEDHVKLNKLEEKPRENAIYDSFDKLVDECKSDLLRQYKRRGSAQGTAIQPPEVFRISARCFSAPSLKNTESPVAFSVQSREHSFDPGREEALSQIAPLLLTALPHASPQTINNFTLSHCELECAVGEPAEKTPCSSVYPDTLLQSSPEGQIQLKKSTQDQDNLSTSSTSSDPQHNSNDGREDEATNTRLNDQNHNLIVCENEFLGHNFGTFQGKIGPNSSSNENSIQENDYHSFSSNDENRNGEKREYVDGVIRQISSTTNQANGHKGEGDFSEQCIGEEKEGVSLTSDESEYYDSPCKDVCIHSELFCVKHEESGETGDCSEIYSKESEQPSVSSEENRQTSVLSKHIIKGSDNTSISHDESEGGEFNASDVNGKVYNEENEQISTFSKRSKKMGMKRKEGPADFSKAPGKEKESVRAGQGAHF
ncbi:uncharacterized protein LOC119588116 [Penaeus monodon]|uniref:uncharacterized protein LOC119588116 n=1 Tax=Penaeus monodon TaxID=6687 RepID=UPI0018A6E250|nr:uncharacterized protein LOC119588116 [Penaeus monodon]